MILLGFFLGAIIGVAVDDNPVIGCLLGLGAGFVLRNMIRSMLAQEAKKLRDSVDAQLKAENSQTIKLLADLRARIQSLEGQAGGSSVLAPTAENGDIKAPAPFEPAAVQTAVASNEPQAVQRPQDEGLLPATAMLPGASPERIQIAFNATEEAHEGRSHEPQASEFQEKLEPQGPSLWERLISGNLVAKIGAVLLFFGVGFLLKYAYDHSVLPAWTRLVGIAAIAVVLFLVATRLLVKRRAYALVLMGAATGLLYLDVFFGLRLFGYIAPTVAFGLFILLGVATVLLAVRMDAQSLAVLGLLGAFLAPILASTGQGNHVILFSYYTLLNLFILAVAWFKSWRPLNLTGFLFTFVIVTVWGVLSYSTDRFATTEPFLIIFFAIYVLIPILFATRQPPQLKGLVDGTLVFGTPLSCTFFQAALVSHLDDGAGSSILAWSAFSAGLVYLALAGLILRVMRRAELNLLGQTYFALAAVFLSAAIYFAFDPYPTFALWTLEGCAIVWVALRQQRPLTLLFGVLLQTGAAFYFLDQTRASDWAHPLFNPYVIGCLLIALSGLLTSWLTNRLIAKKQDDAREPHKLWSAAALLDPLGAIWGSVWWLAAGASLLAALFPDENALTHAWLFSLAASALLAEGVGQRLDWLSLRRIAAVLPAALLILVLAELEQSGITASPLADYGGLIWPFAFTAAYFIVYRQEKNAGTFETGLQHLLLFWGVTIFLQRLALWLLHDTWLQPATLDTLWWVALALPTLLMLAGFGLLANRDAWPYRASPQSYLRYGVLPLLLWAIIWTVGANLDSDGAIDPLRYLPILNPLDLIQIVLFVVIASWHKRCAEVLRIPKNIALLISGGLVFLWINATLMRTLHHWMGVPYELDAMLSNPVSSSALSLLWTVTAMMLMMFGVKKVQRGQWIAGAALLALVVLKLFSNDLGNTGTIARIVSFIGVGGLLLLIGYLAPLPPARVVQTDQSKNPERSDE